MNEFWVCEGCKSLVSGRSGRCYSCRAPRPAEAKEVGSGVTGAVVTPGIDDGLQDVAFTLAEGKRVIPTGILASLTVAGVIVVVLATLVQIGLSVYMAVLFLNRGLDSVFDPALGVVSLVVSLVLLVAAPFSLLCWLIFQAVSMRNAPLLGAGNARRSIPGALLWWFVPVLNIWVPIRVVADLHARLGSKGSSGQLVVGIWWTCFIASAFFGYILTAILTVSAVGFGLAGLAGFRVGIAPTMEGVTMGATLLGVVSQGLQVVAGVAFIAVIVDLHRRQVERREWMEEGRERFVATEQAARAAGAEPLLTLVPPQAG